MTVTVSDDPQVTVNKATLPFTAGNWSTAQTVTVTAVNDAIVEGGHTGLGDAWDSGGIGSGVSRDHTGFGDGEYHRQ